MDDGQYHDFDLYSSGFLIGKNMVLTAAHSVYFNGDYLNYYALQKFASSVNFYPFMSANNGVDCKSVNFAIVHDNYFDFESNYGAFGYVFEKPHDWALLILKESISSEYRQCGVETKVLNLNSPSYLYGYPYNSNNQFNAIRATITSSNTINHNCYDLITNTGNTNLAGASGGPIVNEYGINNAPYVSGIYTTKNLDSSNGECGGVIISNIIIELAEEFGYGF